MNIIPVILAGGIGERFWPLSRSESPKQLLRIISSRTMVEETLRRVAPLCKKPAKPLIITGKKIVPRMKRLLSAAPDYDLISEPEGKNTAPAILLAAAWIEKKYGTSIMVIVSADHDIKPRSSFLSSVRKAVAHARGNDDLVVFGIRPTRPETGYGYLQIHKNPGSDVLRVSRFVEKPALETAKKYIKSGSHLWNSGMFVWKSSTIIREFQNHLPELHSLVSELCRSGFSPGNLQRYYSRSPAISIDYGIMERSGHVVAVAADFTWDDIGSWEALPRIHGIDKNGNTTAGKHVWNFESRNSIVFNGSEMAVATIGLENTVVVITGDAILAVHRSHLPEIKYYLARMKKGGNCPKRLF